MSTQAQKLQKQAVFVLEAGLEQVAGRLRSPGSLALRSEVKVINP